jgi:hypothetical protein
MTGAFAIPGGADAPGCRILHCLLAEIGLGNVTGTSYFLDRGILMY